MGGEAERRERLAAEYEFFQRKPILRHFARGRNRRGGQAFLLAVAESVQPYRAHDRFENRQIDEYAAAAPREAFLRRGSGRQRRETLHGDSRLRTGENPPRRDHGKSAFMVRNVRMRLLQNHLGSGRRQTGGRRRRIARIRRGSLRHRRTAL